MTATGRCGYRNFEEKDEGRRRKDEVKKTNV
jgi:hypothetical protein